MFSIRTTVLTTVAVVGLAGAAQAVPLTTNPGNLSANGPITAVFAFADASDDSRLLSVGFGGLLFNNQTDPVGTSRNVGTFTGPIAFQLDNLTQGYSFLTGVTDSGAGGDGFFHADYESDFANFGVGSLSSAAATSIAALPGTVLYVGFEDRRGGDYDYNDLIFAFSSVSVPEPASLALLGVGLAGLYGTRRRRNA